MYVETGHLTSITVRRHRMSRESTRDDVCDKNSSMTKDQCMTRCIYSECVVKRDPCFMFNPHLAKKETDGQRVFSGFDVTYCYFAAMYAVGMEPMNVHFFQVKLELGRPTLFPLYI